MGRWDGYGIGTWDPYGLGKWDGYGIGTWDPHGLGRLGAADDDKDDDDGMSFGEGFMNFLDLAANVHNQNVQADIAAQNALASQYQAQAAQYSQPQKLNMGPFIALGVGGVALLTIAMVLKGKK